MKTIYVRLITVSLMVLLCANIEAQSFGEKLGKTIKNSAEKSALRKAEQKTDQAVNKSVDKLTDPNSYKESDNDKSQQVSSGDDSGSGKETKTDNPPASATADTPKALEMTYAKSDFVPGDEIIFDDDQENEQVGEFPSMWDLLQGNAEIATVGGEKVIFLEASGTTIAPLMKEMKSYLSDVFTLELDFWCASHNNQNEAYFVNFYNAKDRNVMSLRFDNQNVRWSYRTPSDESRYGDFKGPQQINNAWRHLSISFNKRAFKAYIDGSRVTNIPNMDVPVRFNIERETWRDHLDYIKDVRLAKGAVPLYDRMMSDGKFITYGITFDVGKSTIKPESMGEINRIVTLMNENPELKFSVEGHTDNTGSAAANQTLSEARSKAIVDKLTELGISADRLAASGKGQNNPIADNATDEGRAKNRRVEFVKM